MSKIEKLEVFSDFVIIHSDSRIDPDVGLSLRRKGMEEIGRVKEGWEGRGSGGVKTLRPSSPNIGLYSVTLGPVFLRRFHPSVSPNCGGELVDGRAEQDFLQLPPEGVRPKRAVW